MSTHRIQIYPITVRHGGGARACAHNETTPPPDRLPVRHRRRRRHRRRHQRRRRQRRRGRRRSTTVKHKVSGRVQGVHVAVIHRRRNRNHRRHRLLPPSFSTLPVIRCTLDARSLTHPTASRDFLDPATGIRRAPSTHRRCRRLVSFRPHMVRRSTVHQPDGSRARAPTMTC